MITQKKQRILEGVIKNLFAKVTGFPTIFMFSAFECNVEYKIDILNGVISPTINLSGSEITTFKNLLTWFESELETRKIDKVIIQMLEVTFLCNSKRKLMWLIPTKNYYYKVQLISDREVFTKETSFPVHFI